VYLALGQLDVAMPRFEEVLQRRQAKLGPNHPNTLASKSHLAEAYEAAGRRAEALALFEEVFQHRRAQRGLGHPYTLRSLVLLSRAYLADRPEQAEPLLRQALPIFETKTPEDWLTFQTRSLLGRSLQRQKKYAEAEPHLLRGYAGMKAREANIPAPSKQILSQAALWIRELYAASGKKEKAEEWRKERRSTPAEATPESL
jgi:non-specific serine/threonine protein kinase/serine/threonine-protein kinase